MSTHYEDQDGEGAIVLQASAVESMTRAEVDIQVSTAQRYPKHSTAEGLVRFKKQAIALIESDREVAESCFYTLKRKDKEGNEKIISDGSIRLAEIVAAAYGNLHYGSRTIGDDGKFVTAQGVCWDLEANNRCSKEVVRRVTTSKGKRYGDDMVGMTMNSSQSLALRNAIFTIVPKGLTKSLLDLARTVARGTVSDLPKRRDNALKWFARQGIKEDVILKYLGKSKSDEIDLDDMETLVGVKTSIQDGHVTAANAFTVMDEENGADRKPEDGERTRQAAADIFAGKSAEKEPPKEDAKVEVTPEKSEVETEPEQKAEQEPAPVQKAAESSADAVQKPVEKPADQPVQKSAGKPANSRDLISSLMSAARAKNVKASDVQKSVMGFLANRTIDDIPVADVKAFCDKEEASWATQ